MYMYSSFYSRNGGVTKYIDQLLATFNIFFTVSAFNCRARLCVLGETMMTMLIQLLGNRTQPSKVKVRKSHLLSCARNYNMQLIYCMVDVRFNFDNFTQSLHLIMYVL